MRKAAVYILKVMGLKKPVKRIRSEWTTMLKILRVHWEDFLRFRSYSSALHFTSEAQRISEVLRHVHGLEKGLAMPTRRRTFGIEHISETRRMLSEVSKSPENNWIWNYSEEVISKVERWNLDNQYDPRSSPGLRFLRKQEVIESGPRSPERFFGTRRSVRKFSEEPIPKEQLLRAIQLATEAPSACNRQSSRVRVYSGDMMQNVLRIQMGSSGFGHLASAVIVVTSDLRCFFRNGEQKQPFVDGGIFLMSLIFAFHSLGMGSCALNWSVDRNQDLALRKYIKLPDHEVVIALLAIGMLNTEYEVAESRRRPLSEVLMN
jgi:nitroreductase